MRRKEGGVTVDITILDGPRRPPPLLEPRALADMIRWFSLGWEETSQQTDGSYCIVVVMVVDGAERDERLCVRYPPTAVLVFMCGVFYFLYIFYQRRRCCPLLLLQAKGSKHSTTTPLRHFSITSWEV